IERYRFDGHQLLPHQKPLDCWWFNDKADGTVVIHQGSVLGRGPSTGTRRWCYQFVSLPLAEIVKIDWQEITTTVLFDIFKAWSNDSALNQMGLGDCIRECAPRRKAVRDLHDPVILNVWN